MREVHVNVQPQRLPPARDWVVHCIQRLPARRFVLELTGCYAYNRRDLFQDNYLNIQLERSHGIALLDRVIKCKPDTVICAGVLEHIKNGRMLCQTIHRILDDDGVFIVECATMMALQHAYHANDRDGWYSNVHPGLLRWWLKCFQWRYITVVPSSGHLYAIAGKGLRYYAPR